MKKSALLTLMVLVLTCGVGLAQTTAFTYQGKLTDVGSPANGQYDFKFKLFDLVSGGTQIGTDVLSDDLQVTAGVFAVNLDFGASPFTSGAPRYLEIAVRAGASTGVYTMLAPRQLLTSSPYSIRTLSATSADGLSAVCNPCVSDTQIIAVDGSKVSGIMPNAALAAGNITGILGPLSGGTGIGGIFPVADTFLRSNGAGWTASGLLPSDIPGGSTSYIRNATSPQASSNFNIIGTGTADIFNAGTQYNIGGNRILSSPVDNIFAGRTAGTNNTSGNLNSFFGNRSGEANIGGSSNSFFGERSGLNSQSVNNSFFGAVAGRSNVSGNNNTIIGTLADVAVPDLTFATAIGAGAVVRFSNTVALGRTNDTVEIPGALSVTGGATFGGTLGANIFNAATQFNLGGNRVLTVTGLGSSTFVGWNAGVVGPPQSDNSFFGSLAGSNTIGGNFDSFFGALAGQTNGNGSNNTVIGSHADVGASNLFNATAIGANTVVSQSNSLVLGSINGVNGATFDTNVGIGTTAPEQRLHVVGNEVLSTGSQSGFKFRDRGSASAGDDWVWYSFGNVARFFRAGVGDLLTMKTNGNVGIGTSAPTYKLHVVGDAVSVEGDATSIFPSFLLNFTGGAPDSKRWKNYASPNTLVFSALNDAENFESPWLKVNRAPVSTIESVEFPNGSVVAPKVFVGGAFSTIFQDQLTVNGTIFLATLGSAGGETLCRNGAHQISTCGSSIRYKQNISPFIQGLSLVKKLRPVSFNWRANNQADFGLVAEEVGAVEPLLTTVNDKGEVEGVKYDRIGVVLVNAVQEQQRQIEAQQKQIEEQRALINQQQEKSDQQQAEINALKILVCSQNPTAESCKLKE